MKRKYISVFRMHNGESSFVAGFDRHTLPWLSQADEDSAEAMVSMLISAIEDEGDEAFMLESHEPNWVGV